MKKIGSDPVVCAMHLTTLQQVLGQLYRTITLKLPKFLGVGEGTVRNRNFSRFFLQVGHETTYLTCAIINRGLYINYPILKSIFKEVFWEILSLCMVSIQERFLIKSGL